MAEFLTTQGTSHHIENIIIDAKNWLILVSPFLKLSKNFYERLMDADRREVSITLIYGKDELKPDELSKLEQLSNLSLYFFENLHAKCFFNEGSMVITSMNMYEYSEKNNREMGILIRKEVDTKVFDDAVKEVRSIINSSRKVDLRKYEFRSHPTEVGQLGFCIRCRTPIPYDLVRPYCRKCFLVWSEWEKLDYEESYCHTCGEPEPTTITKPRCYPCYNR